MQTDPDLLPDLYALLRPFVGAKQDLTASTDLVSELGLTSLKIMDLLMEIEDQFDVTVPLNRLSEVRTVGDLAAMLEKLVSGSSS